ncbi:MAG: hypothetical protein Kapaf2KO_03370 [Candidatus Kapaibacteriales bacterium]
MIFSIIAMFEKLIKNTLVWLSAATIIMLTSCGGDEYADIEPTPIEGLETYKNDIYKYSIDLPANWIKKESGTFKRVTSYSFEQDEAKDRFSSYDYNGYPIAKVDLIVVDLDSTRTFEDAFSKFQLWPPEVYEAPEDITLDGKPGKKLSYKNPHNDGLFEGTLYGAQHDSTIATFLVLETFTSTREIYASDFDKIVSSLKLAQTPEEVGDTLFVTNELPPPSDTLASMSGSGFTIRVPKNFKKSNRGGATVFDGERRGDSYLSIDVSKAAVGSSKAAADKVKEQVGGSVSKATLGGKEAYYVAYSPTGSISRRIYLLVQNNKLYRITMDWAKEEQDLYLPVFEKSVATFKVN